MMNRKGLLPIVAIAGLVLLLFVSRPAAQWLAVHLGAHTPEAIEVGHLVDLTGAAKIIHGDEIHSIKAPLAKHLVIRAGDRLEVAANSKAVLILNSKDEFEVEPLSSLQFQLWDPGATNSPIYVVILKGDVTLRQPGLRRRAFLVRDGKLYLPGQKVTHEPMALTVLKSAPLDMELANSGEPDTDKSDAADKGAAKPAAPAAGRLAKGPETLSNEYISETISGQTGLLQRCWISHLRDAPNSNGTLQMQFDISNSGNVENAQVLSSTLDDQTLKDCVLSVFQRLTFMPFTGAKISLTYPIHFE